VQGFLFDGIDYIETLAHLGRPTTVPNLKTAVLMRTIRNSRHVDALGPWPYGSAPEAETLPEAFAALKSMGAVSFTGMLRPDAALDPAAARRVGAAAVPLKDHFIADGDRGRPALSPKTRRNLAIAERHWSVAVATPALDLVESAATLHLDLQKRRHLSTMTRMPPGHFQRLIHLPGVAVLTARDGAGTGAMLIAAHGADETHLLHLLVDRRALRTCAAHLLMASAVELWGSHRRVYLGGTPDGPDGPGIARFKARWANRTSPVWLLTAILHREAYAELSRRAPGSGYFPIYRNPGVRTEAPGPERHMAMEDRSA